MHPLPFLLVVFADPLHCAPRERTQRALPLLAALAQLTHPSTHKQRQGET